MLQVKYAAKCQPKPPLRRAPVRAFTDNYIWLIESPGARPVVAVDPGEPLR
jgi:hypothetical protein